MGGAAWPLVWALCPLAGFAAPAAEHAMDGGRGEAVEMDVFDWRGGEEVMRTTQLLVDEPAEMPTRRLTTAAQARRTSGTDEASLLFALWDRPRWRDARFNLSTSEGEHPCFAGFLSMIQNTSRCNGFVRQYPPIGGKVAFLNTGVNAHRSFTLGTVVARHINVWLEEGTTEAHAEVAMRAARIYSNDFDAAELRPAPGSRSWMEHECKVLGSLPFLYTCSDRVNVLVQQCNVENAWVRPSDFLRNFPGPADGKSSPNHDIIFYMCKELIDRNPNPYAAATTFAHELAHVIQGGFGSSFNAMAEGGATWLEGPLLGLPPRPMVYAYGFEDWNRINAAHLYANTKELNSRKFYQIHAMFLTYLSQEALLGAQATSALQNYQTFEPAHVPWGRMAYDYFLASLGRARPLAFEPVRLDAQSPHNAFASALLDFRVALAAQCIADPARRPSEVRYLMPPSLRDRPFWDCSSYATHWSAAGSAVRRAAAALHYGGAAAFRLLSPRNCTVSVELDADPRVRTKVLAAGTAEGDGAQVRELGPGESARFRGARELFVVQVNADPAGELVPSGLWRRSPYRCQGLCQGSAWTTAAGADRPYPPDRLTALRSPIVHLPLAEATLTFVAMWDMEPTSADGSFAAPGCKSRGYDGVQVRVRVLNRSNTSDPALTDGVAVAVLHPDGGYGCGPSGEVALHVFGSGAAPGVECDDLAGWTGRGAAGLSFSRASFSLAPFAGRAICVEIVFGSDSGAAGEGFWMDDLQIRAGAALVFADDAEDGSAMLEHPLVPGPVAGSVGRSDGVPVVVDLGAGHAPDRGLQRALETLKAPWSATWAQAGRWVSLRSGTGAQLVLDGDRLSTSRDDAGGSGQFQLLHNRDGTASFRTPQGAYLRAEQGGALSAANPTLDDSGKFELIDAPDGSTALRTRDGAAVAVDGAGPVGAGGEGAGARRALELVYRAPASADEAALRRAYLGWSYSAPLRRTRTALLRPWQEACVRLAAPFSGSLRSATLLTLVDKMGVGAVALRLRAASHPHEPLAGGEAVSLSPGVADPGVHRFGLPRAPALGVGAHFLACVGAAAAQPLAADEGEAFLHLPLTAVGTAGAEGQPGATFLLVTQDHGADRAGSRSRPDPWAGHTVALRGDFVECHAQAAARQEPTGFLAPQPGQVP